MDDSDWRDYFDLDEPQPQDPNQLWGSSHAAIARELYERGDYKRALDKAVKAIEAFPLDCGAYLIAGDCLTKAPDIHRLTELAMDERTAEGYYHSALMHTPTDMQKAYAYERLSQSAAEVDAWEEAARLARRSLVIAENAKLYLQLSTYETHIEGDWLTPLSRAIELDPELWYLAPLHPAYQHLEDELHTLLGSMYREIRQQGLEAYHRALAAIDEAETALHAAHGADTYTRK